MHEKSIIITPTLICVVVTPLPREVSVGTLDVVAPAAGRVVVGALCLALLHAAAATSIPRAATRPIRRVARATSLRARPPRSARDVLVFAEGLPVAVRRQRRVELLELEGVVVVVLALAQRGVGT